MKQHDFSHQLKVTRMGIDTQQELVVYMRPDCHVCRSEGFVAQTRVRLSTNNHYIIAKLNVVNADHLEKNVVGLSDSAWKKLGVSEGDEIGIEHPDYLTSLSYVRSKIYGNRLPSEEISSIVRDIADGRYSDVHLATFLTACAGDRLDLLEIVDLTRSMVDVGETLSWPEQDIVLDKHCVGGLPGNRTTPIVVSIVAAAGLSMPKTSSRSITSPAGTADTMEVLAPVNLGLDEMRSVVNQEGACLVWGGSINLSPADDLLIRVERTIDLDSEGQLIASVLSKKIAAGATHVLIDIPLGITAKLRTEQRAKHLATLFVAVGNALGIMAVPLITEGTQPVGNGIGPAQEAQDILSVLQRKSDAPADLRKRAVMLAAKLLEISGRFDTEQATLEAEGILNDGRAWKKFQAICQAQGGLREIPLAEYSAIIRSRASGLIKSIDNRQLAQIAKLAGAPKAKTAGLKLHKKLDESVMTGEPLMTLYAATLGELTYAENYYSKIGDVFKIEY